MRKALGLSLMLLIASSINANQVKSGIVNFVINFSTVSLNDIRINFYEEIFSNRMRMPDSILSARAKEKTTEFQLVTKKHVSFFTVSFFGEESTAFVFPIIAGDTVMINVDKSGAKFTGANASWFNCLISFQENRNRFKINGMVDRDKVYRGTTSERLWGKSDAVIRQGKMVDSLLDRYNITKHRGELLAHIRSNMILSSISGLTVAGHVDSPKSQLSSDNIEIYRSLWKGKLPANISESYLYADILYLLAKNELYLDGFDLTAGVNDLYPAILKKIRGMYAGMSELEKVLVVASDFLYETSEENDLLLEEIIASTKNLSYSTLLKDIKEKYKKGKPVYPFVLSNESGENVSLNSFHGKVVVMELWFTGCTGCVQVAEKMKPVIDQYKNDSSVVFLSVSVDRTIKKWQEGLFSGLYAHPNSIKLYTGGEGIFHPFTRFYNFYGFPSFLVIDRNGRIVTHKFPHHPIDKVFQRKFEMLIKSAK